MAAMETVVLDTNIVSFLFRGDSRAASYRQFIDGRRLAISFMTVAELYEGAYRRNWGESKLNKLEQILRSFLVIPFDERICKTWARIRAERKSQPIAVDDAWIAACAAAHQCSLVTHNPKDFQGIDSLKVLTTIQQPG